MLMKQLNENSGSPRSNASNAKKTTTEREFYVCFCAKSYNSYSALYLHAKKKHESNLSMKCLKHTKHEWSGNVKNIFYQFIQQDFDDDQPQQQDSVLARNYRKKSSKDSSSLKNTTLKCTMEKTNSCKFYSEGKLKQTLWKYVQQKNRINPSSDRASLIDDITNFMLTQYKQLKSTPQWRQPQKKTILQIIPHQINNYILNHPQTPSPPKTTIIQLSSLLSWLYDNKYCKQLAIPMEDYVKYFGDKET